MRKSDFTETQIISILKEAENGAKVQDLARTHCSPRERARLRALLRTMTGEVSNEDAAALLDLGLSQFASMRTRALQGAIDALAPGQPGRPRKHDPAADARVRALQAENAALRRQLQEAQLREELALAQVPLRPARSKGGGLSVKRLPH